MTDLDYTKYTIYVGGTVDGFDVYLPSYLSFIDVISHLNFYASQLYKKLPGLEDAVYPRIFDIESAGLLSKITVSME